MNQIEEILKSSLNIEFISATISNSILKDDILKIKVRPVMKKDILLFQLESYTSTQAFHKNLEAGDTEKEILQCMKNFRQLQLETKQIQYTVLISKKGKVTVRKKKLQITKEVDMSHNRTKKYILQEGIGVPFLEDLGVMTREGMVIKSKFDKFRQINRFLEFMEDVIPRLPKEQEVTILDFGCGKSYLTFAIYYYLHELKGYDIRMIGLDLKKDVIIHCNELSKKYGYKKLEFLEGNIADYAGVEEVDMVVTLHACDTATDYALAKAIAWNAKVILSVPCCQHELNGQIQNKILESILKYGLIKERMAALITDAMRAEYLESKGYDVQILEFIDMEHTPKNILIRAVKTGKACSNQEEIDACKDFFHMSPKLGELLTHKGEL